MKRCKKCGELKPLEEFYRATGMRDGRRNDCIPCNLAASKARNAANPFPNRERARRWIEENPERYREKQRRYVESGRKAEWSRNSYLKRTFGMTQTDYEAMLESQGGGCALCHRPPSRKISLHIDHDHKTGRIRGLLCGSCNNGIGLLQEDEEVLLRALDHVRSDPDTQRMIELTRQRLAALRVTSLGDDTAVVHAGERSGAELL